MKIKEVSSLTGLTQKTIRFYESAGLIAPNSEQINGRSFRDYSEADIARLREISVLRKARFSIEEIKTMQESPEQLPDIFHSYHARIRQERSELEQLSAVLDTISEDALTCKSDLVQELQKGTQTMNLPFVDIHPNFKYLDLLEEKLGRKDQKRAAKRAAMQRTAAMTQGATLVQVQTRPGVRDGSMPGTSVLMTMRLLDDSKRED